MSESCPIYRDNFCILKKVFNKYFLSEKLQLTIYDNSDCKGEIKNCSFCEKTEQTDNQPAENQTENTEKIQSNIEKDIDYTTKVSIHLYENPYLIKSDILVYPSNNVLTIDDHLLNQMSRGNIQSELDKIKKPIKMGTVYVTSNGGENSKVQPKVVYHATVAGESRLVNEADIKSSIRKSLHLANEYKARNVVMLPPDCGTHDIFDTARVHLSAVKTYLQAEKSCNLKNIFIVMSDQESFDVYEEYYKRIFK